MKSENTSVITPKGTSIKPNSNLISAGIDELEVDLRTQININELKVRLSKNNIKFKVEFEKLRDKKLYHKISVLNNWIYLRVFYKTDLFSFFMINPNKFNSWTDCLSFIELCVFRAIPATDSDSMPATHSVSMVATYSGA